MNPSKMYAFACLALLAPAAVFARSAGPPIKRTGAAVDGGLNCTACHRGTPVNSEFGRMSLTTTPYQPGVKQTITVRIEDSQAMRWGFQMIARLRSDETKQAGTFTANDNTLVHCNPDERNAPCNGDLEFASHTLAATKPGTPSPGIFAVEWTPPAQDVGEIIFYAAGNAANNSNTNAGDHIYTTSMVIRPVCNLTQKPTLLGAADAASFRSPVSPNSLFSIFGSGFSSSTNSFRAATSDVVDNKLPTSMACIAVEIGGRRAPLLFVNRGQINAQAPVPQNYGDLDMQVILNPGTPNEIRSDTAKVRISVYNPSWFTFDGKTIAGLNVSSNNALLAEPSVVPTGVVAHPGDIVTLFGTGFGYSEPLHLPGEIPGKAAGLRDPFTVSIGGIQLAPADILYAGLTPDTPGLYQFNLRVPAGVADGNAPVVVRLVDTQTQSGATIPIRR